MGSAADGNVDDSELKLITKMAQALEMSGAHLKGILSNMDELISQQMASSNEETVDKEDHSRFMPN